MKIVKWFIFIFLAVLLLVLIGAGILAAKVIDKVPEPLDHSYLRRPKEKEPFLPFHVMKKGQANYEAIKRASPSSIASIQYDDDEFNFLLKTLLYSNLLEYAGVTGGHRISAKRTSIILKNGVFHLKHTIDIPSNPFGKYLNLYFTFRITIKNGEEELKVLSAKVGSVDIPEKYIQAEVQKFLDRSYTGTIYSAVVRECVIDLHTDEQGIFMEYRPYVLRKVIKDSNSDPFGLLFGKGFKNGKKSSVW